MDITEQLDVAASPHEIMKEAKREIESLRRQIAERNKLLADIFNCDAAQKEEIPSNLLRRIDELVFFPKRKDMSANASLTGGEAVRLKR